MVMNVKEHILAAIRKCLAKNLTASGKAILFGSQARGTAREDSDWDILIILDKEPDGLDFFTFYLKKSSFFRIFFRYNLVLSEKKCTFVGNI